MAIFDERIGCRARKASEIHFSLRIMRKRNFRIRVPNCSCIWCRGRVLPSVTYNASYIVPITAASNDNAVYIGGGIRYFATVKVRSDSCSPHPSCRRRIDSKHSSETATSYDATGIRLHGYSAKSIAWKDVPTPMLDGAVPYCSPIGTDDSTKGRPARNRTKCVIRFSERCGIASGIALTEAVFY